MATKHTVKLKNYSNVFEEMVANAVVTPGMLVEVMTTGKVRAHATAGGSAIPMFAMEDELQGNGIDVAYAAADPITVWIPGRGDQVYALLDDGENVSIGNFLESAGNGFLQKYVADVTDSAESDNIIGNQIVAQALEAVNLSDSSDTWPTAARRIAVRIV